MNSHPEMRGSFQLQRLPAWLRDMISGEKSSFSNPIRSNNSTNYFQSNQHNEIRNMNSFPFYRFGNWNSNSVTIRIQTSQPIQDQFGTYFNLGASFDNTGNYHFLKYSGGADRMEDYQVIASFPSRFQGHLGTFHAYGMTENYFVFCEQPWCFDMNRMGHSDFSWDCMNYMQGEYNHFYILDKRNGRCMETRYATDKPYFFYNFINCYEVDNRVVIDAMGYDGPNFGVEYKSPRFFQERYSSSKIMRFEFPIIGGFASELSWNGPMFQRDRHHITTLRPQFLFPQSGILNPCINPNYNFRKHQFTYGMSENSLMKLDTFGGRNQAWRGNDYNWRPLKTMFVANPSGRSEDDGILIACMSDSQSRRAMVFIDPRTMEELYRYPLEGSFGSGHPLSRFFN